uniref:Putative vitellogenin-1 n=1 Tax=Haematobia irritans TaxID=7368 RepID=A0A1L8EI29_HAEIR
MNPLKALCVVAFFAAAVCAAPSHQQYSSNLKPSQWLSKSQLERTPSLSEIDVQRLESMPLEEGAKVLETIYHVAQINNELEQNYAPHPSSIPVYIVMSNGQKVSTTLDKMAETANQDPEFGNEEVTIFITGLPSTTETVEKANRKLVEAYVERYSGQRQKPINVKFARNSNKNQYDDDNNDDDDEQDYDWSSSKRNSGNLVVIALGEKLPELKHQALLDVEKVGEMIAIQIVKLDVPNDIVHIIGQNVAAHVAGAAGQEYKSLTGNKLARITALDPSKLYAKDPETLTGLSRGDAKFVDAIHTSALGMGTLTRVGNVDIFPNGPCAGVPGTDNVVAASMRATQYFAESVVPGNERNFPAVEANSLESYKQNNGYGKRVYMGIDLATDLEGDYILEVNAHSPFGKRASAKKQNSHYAAHKSWKNTENFA